MGPTAGTGTARAARAAAAAAVLLAAAAAARGDAVGLAWAVAVPASTLAVVAAARRPGLAGPARWAAAAYLVGLAAATIAASLAGLGLDEAGRFEGLARDANVAGAALVVAAAAWAALAPRARWAALATAAAWALAGTAVVYTGSRAAAAAGLLAAVTWAAPATAAWVAARTRRGGRGWAWAPLALVGLLALGAVAWQRGVVEVAPNLLAAPSDFAHRDWRHDLAASVAVDPAAAEGPFPGTRAQRVRAAARPGERALLLQTIGRSEPGVPYVASIYLRADTPQRVVVSNHLTEAPCDVGPTWTRCVSPVGVGDGVLQAMFYLLAAEPGGAVDVLAFGAQYEVGTAATPFLDRRPPWLPQALVRRLDLRRLELLPDDRRAIWAAAVDLARTSPWVGLGAPAAASALAERTASADGAGVTQAHNAFLHLWLVRGVLGVAAAALLLGALAAAVPRAGWPALAPLLVALVMTNTWDVTLGAPWVAVPALLAVAGVGAVRAGR